MPIVLPSAERNADTIADDGGRKLTGLRVLFILLTFFGTVAGVNAVMIYSALSTFRGEVTAHPYEEGLAFNSEIGEARAQAARGWKVDGKVVRSADGQATIEVAARDASGAALTGLQMEAILAAPADKKRDHTVKLADVGGGAYRAVVATQSGAWDFELSAARDGKKVFQSRNRITLE
jgi:nitrogen fixation protein FixH